MHSHEKLMDSIKAGPSLKPDHMHEKILSTCRKIKLNLPRLKIIKIFQNYMCFNSSLVSFQVDDEEAGVIVEIPGDPLCPVKTLKFYLSRLNPACRALFQRPKEHIYDQDTCWYVNSPVGKNMLATMMSTISKCARLSRIYTNVRIRATTYSPADGKGCIPCTNVAEPLKYPDNQESKSFEKRLEIAPKPIQTNQNSHIIKQLNAPIVQACLSVAVSKSLSTVSNAASPIINRVFPLTIPANLKSELLNGQALSLKKEEVC